MSTTYSAGIATAYGAAVRGGYTGTYEQWCALMADYAAVGQRAEEAAAAAAQSESAAAASETAAASSAAGASASEDNAADSATAAQTAQTGAETAQTAAAGSATAAAQSATQAASSAATAAEVEQQAEAVRDSIPADYTALSDTVDRLERAAIYEDASGDLVSISDGADGGKVRALTIGIEPVQDGSGDPSPDNVRPITVVSTIAIHHAGASAEYTYENGGLNDAGEESTASSYHRSTYIDVHGAKNVYVQYSAPSGAWTMRVCAYDKNGEFLSLMRKQTHSANATWNATLTIPDDAAYIRFSIKISATMDICVFDDSAIQLTLPSEVYGGSVTLNPDGSADVSACPYYASYAGEALAGPWVSSMDVYSAGVTPTTGAQVVDLGGEKTVTHIPAAYTPPILTLLGANNVWADCGPIEALTYPADTKLYVDGQTKVTRSLIAGIETSMTASKPYATGDLLIVGDTLYKVAAPIASGAAFTPGTNVNPTTVAEQLLLLANA